MPEGLRKMLFYGCLLVFALGMAACARDVDVRARGEAAVSIGVGRR